MAINILHEIKHSAWDMKLDSQEQLKSTDLLEQGHILYFSQLPFLLQPEEQKFLSPDFADPKNKNISFDAQTKLVKGALFSETEQAELGQFLQRFSLAAEQLIRNVFPTYASALEIGRTSFRPVEIAGRATSYRKDDTRLHVDAFPATPNQGRRILRVFSNINPHGLPRVWRIGESFREMAKRFLPNIARPWYGKATLLQALKFTKSYRTEYDHFMLQMHDRMKADLGYQQSVPQAEIQFAAGTTWIVQTDQVSHAAMKGQYVLEQTFYLPVAAMKTPAFSPLRILEQLRSRRLV